MIHPTLAAWFLKALDYSGFAAIAIEAIQELYERFEAALAAQSARIGQLETELEALRTGRGDR